MYFPLNHQMQELDSFYSPTFTNFVHSDDYDEDTSSDGKKFLSCKFPGCGKVFRFPSESTRHKLIHTSQRPFECPFKSCVKSFKREDALRGHIRIHTGEKPYRCEEPGCCRSFSNKAGLRYHTLKHKGEKDYLCDFPGCNKGFLTIHQLKQHEITHVCHWKPIKLVANEPRAAKKFKCEVESLDASIQDEKIESHLQEEFERTIKVILKENDAMRESIKMWDQLKEINQEKKNKNLEEASDVKDFAFLQYDNQERFYKGFC